MDRTDWSRILTIALATSLIGMGVFAYQWWSVREHLKEQTKAVEELSDQLLKDKEFIGVLKQETERIREEVRQVEADETADWKTYRNEEFEFEFKYPPLFTTISDNTNTKSSNTVVFYDFETAETDKPILRATVFIPPHSIEAGHYVELGGETIGSYTWKKVGGPYSIGEERIEENATYLRFSVEKNKDIGLSIFGNDKQMLRIILSTFRFIE